MNKTVLASFVAVIALSGPAASARADVIRLTSGVIEAANSFGLGDPWFLFEDEAFHLEGPGLSISDSLVSVMAPLQLAVPPTAVASGAPFDASGVLHVEDTFVARFNNATGLLAAPFTMTFDAEPTRVNCGTSNGLTQCSGSAPFTFRANLLFTTFGGTPNELHLIGGGTAEGRLLSGHGSESGIVRYTFGASPTPEPATLSLFGAGVLMAGTRRRRRRRRARDAYGLYGVT
jgi:hypothetical protein